MTGTECTHALASEEREPQGITYGHPCTRVTEARVRAARAVTAELIGQGVIAFSPVSYTHTLAADFHAQPRSGWYQFDLNFMEQTQELLILELPGWEESRGMLIEKSFALARKMQIRHKTFEEIIPLLDEGTTKCLREGQPG